jgi:CMP-N-acetylneuraminic acid synthetase
MIRGQPLTAVIPVRGGSKGIPGKNLRRLGRDTLLERSIKQAKHSDHVDRVVVSTDHPQMHAIAQRHGVAMPALRPAELATDDAKTVDVVLHVMDTLRLPAGYILLVQATSPLRTLADLNEMCDAFDRDLTADAIVTLVRHDSPHPDKIQTITDGYVASYLGRESMVSRQSLPEVYAFNGAFYLTHSDILRRERTFLPKRTRPYVMPAERSLNLDHELDFVLMEAMIEKRLIAIEDYD